MAVGFKYQKFTVADDGIYHLGDFYVPEYDLIVEVGDDVCNAAPLASDEFELVQDGHGRQQVKVLKEIAADGCVVIYSKPCLEFDLRKLGPSMLTDLNKWAGDVAHYVGYMESRLAGALGAKVGCDSDLADRFEAMEAKLDGLMDRQVDGGCGQVLSWGHDGKPIAISAHAAFYGFKHLEADDGDVITLADVKAGIAFGCDQEFGGICRVDLGHDADVGAQPFQIEAIPEGNPVDEIWMVSTGEVTVKRFCKPDGHLDPWVAELYETPRIPDAPLIG